MIELNVRFQEKYKQLDALCKDMFSSRDGVSVYIDEMENTAYQLRYYADDWEIVYKQLKHLRWIRNQLAHEVGAFESDLCTYDDLNWLNDFYNSILDRADPLSVVAQAKRKFYEKPTSATKTATKDNQASTDNSAKISLWSRIKAKLKSWFLN